MVKGSYCTRLWRVSTTIGVGVATAGSASSSAPFSFSVLSGEATSTVLDGLTGLARKGRVFGGGFPILVLGMVLLRPRFNMVGGRFLPWARRTFSSQ